ncbi:MAG: hypothetical protein NT167_32175 [Verrucomicrobia bacterium]|nr:hypothetical protein [Verrucomicrobiota bacterium]
MNKTKRLLLATVVLVAQLPALAQTPFVPNEPHYIPRTNYSLSNGVAGAASGTNLAPDIKYFTSPRNGRVLFIQNNEPAPASAKAQVSLPVGRTNPAAIVQRAELHRPGHRSLPGVSNAVATADRFLAQHGAALGSSKPAEELTAQWVETDGLGMTHAHYLQQYRGVPVFGAEASVHLDRQGVVRSAGGYLAPGLAVDTAPLLTTNDAVARATGYWFGQFPQGTAPETARTKLYVLAMDVVRHDGDPSVYLVWEVEQSTDCPAHACEYYYVDAHSGTLRLHLTGTRQLNRQVFDCSYGGGVYDACGLNDFDINYDYYGRSEGQPARGPNPHYPGQNSRDVDNLYEVYFPAIMAYYQTNFARNGGNNRGRLGDDRSGLGYVNRDYGTSTAYTYVEFLSTYSGQSDTAWSGQYYVAFGGCILTNDTFGHEYGHAVTYSSHLDGSGYFIGMVYQGESGALDENWANIAGEMFEVARTGNCCG